MVKDLQEVTPRWSLGRPRLGCGGPIQALENMVVKSRGGRTFLSVHQIIGLYTTYCLTRLRLHIFLKILQTIFVYVFWRL